MNKVLYMSVIVSLLSLFTACDMTGPESGQSSEYEGKVAVRVQIGSANRGRTVSPAVALQDVSMWELWGGGQGDTETLLAEFSSTEGTTVKLVTGTWHFTLKGYKDSAIILSGNIAEQLISFDPANVLEFTVAPVMEGTGTVSIVIELPADSGITVARIFQDGIELGSSVTPSNNSVVFEGTYPVGDYYFSIHLYKGADLYGVVSELAQVRANLASEKTYTLTWEDLQYIYLISYHLWEGQTGTGSYLYTDAALTLSEPTRIGYDFRGWYADADFSGSAVTEIPAGSRGNKDFYAKWTVSEIPPNLSLADSLAWLDISAVEGAVYTIILSADESIEPKTLSYSGKTISLTIQGGAAERTVSLSSPGSLFTAESGVTLKLDNNVTLQGLNSNTASLVRVNTGGTLVLNGANLINNSNSSGSGGGVYVSGGVFTMNSGTISGNTASSYGGGVYVESGAFIKQLEGIIYGSNNINPALNNTAFDDNYGHTVYINSSAQKRNTTAGVGVSLDSSKPGVADGWE